MAIKSNEARANKAARSVLMSLIVSLSTVGSAMSQALPEVKDQQLKQPKVEVKAPAPAKKAPASTSDILLVMPNAAADTDETFAALKEVHGTIVGTMGEGPMTVLIVKTEKDKLAETEKKLSGDKHFTAVQRDFLVEDLALTSAAVPDDPSRGWELAAVGVTPRGWTQRRGQGMTIAIADSGCQFSNPDLLSKTYLGYDAVNGQEGNGFTDIDANGSHGTACATTAAARTNNGKLTASPAGDAMIYPIKIAKQSGSSVVASELAIIRAVYQAGSKGIRILNVSYGGHDARYSFANPWAHPVLHAFLKWYHDSRNGLAFFAAGNDDQYDPNSKLSYLIMVSAMNSRYGITRFSNYGKPVWFIAPGESITCSTRASKVATLSGTSFASPMVAGIAAAVWSKNPGMSNRQVESALVQSCGNSGRWLNSSFGYGLPNVERALNNVR